MKHLQGTSDLRTFIPAKDFALSRAFYADLGAEERWTSDNMVLLQLGGSTFYLQDSYVKDWAANTMLFLNVPQLDAFWEELNALDLPSKYPGVKTKPPQDYDWGLRELYLHDPAGVLWHFARDIV
ncbi:MAG: VOC family protein [Bacteroidota bacterium]